MTKSEAEMTTRQECWLFFMVNLSGMLSSKFSHILDRPLSAFAKRITVSPDVITLTGLVVTLIPQ